MRGLRPFENESDVVTVGDLSIENRSDRVSLYGSLDITLDKAGWRLAMELKEAVDAVVAAMAGRELPDVVAVAEEETVDNMFK